MHVHVFPASLVLQCRSARDLATGKVGRWGTTQVVYSVEEPLAANVSTEDSLVKRFFGNVVPLNSILYVSEVESVEFLGDVFEANCSWVVHESCAHADLAAPALAKLERVLEVATGLNEPRILYGQFVRFPDLKLQLSSANIVSISDDDLSAARTQDELLPFEGQAITPLQHSLPGNKINHFVFLR